MHLVFDHANVLHLSQDDDDEDMPDLDAGGEEEGGKEKEHDPSAAALEGEAEKKNYTSEEAEKIPEATGETGASATKTGAPSKIEELP